MHVTLTPPMTGGTITVPASKSMAHRALICATFANGHSTLRGFTDSEDMRATQRALAMLGATFTVQGNAVHVQGVGTALQLMHKGVVDCGESGSTLRFLIPVFAHTGECVTLTGHGRLLDRPQNVYKELFLSKNIQFTQDKTGITVSGSLSAGDYILDGSVSSQFITGLALALSLSQGASTIAITPPFESKSYVDLTLQAMRDFGFTSIDWADDFTLAIGEGAYAPRTYDVEKDWSQAAFFAVLGALCGNVTLQWLRVPSAQGDSVILDILTRCGAQFTHENGNIICHKSTLTGIEIDLADCPDLGPVLMVLGLFCEGETIIRNAGRLRIKESDRIDAMERELRKMGADITSTQGTVLIRHSVLHGSDTLVSHNDHRVVMALSVAAMGANVPITIADAQAVNKSYPNFFADVQTLGVTITTR